MWLEFNFWTVSESAAGTQCFCKVPCHQHVKCPFQNCADKTANAADAVGELKTCNANKVQPRRSDVMALVGPANLDVLEGYGH